MGYVICLFLGDWIGFLAVGLCAAARRADQLTEIARLKKEKEELRGCI